MTISPRNVYITNVKDDTIGNANLYLKIRNLAESALTIKYTLTVVFRDAANVNTDIASNMTYFNNKIQQPLFRTQIKSNLENVPNFGIVTVVTPTYFPTVNDVTLVIQQGSPTAAPTELNENLEYVHHRSEIGASVLGGLIVLAGIYMYIQKKFFPSQDTKSTNEDEEKSGIQETFDAIDDIMNEHKNQ